MNFQVFCYIHGIVNDNPKYILSDQNIYRFPIPAVRILKSSKFIKARLNLTQINRTSLEI